MSVSYHLSYHHRDVCVWLLVFVTTWDIMDCGHLHFILFLHLKFELILILSKKYIKYYNISFVFKTVALASGNAPIGGPIYFLNQPMCYHIFFVCLFLLLLRWLQLLELLAEPFVTPLS
jgi:hypothetical protein